MDCDKILFRASANGLLMIEPKSKTEALSETTKTYLRQLYREKKYNRKKEISNKYIEKGLAVEEDAITLYSRINRVYFKKNETYLHNNFICGTPDIFIGESITSAKEIIDIKASWNLFTFPFAGDKINPVYYWQLQSYMALTGATGATLAYCLIDTPEVLRNDEKRRLMWKMGAATEESPLFIEAAAKLEKEMVFGDIPLSERVITFNVERNNDDILRLYERIKKCRAYLNNLENPVDAEPIITPTAPAQSVKPKITLIKL